MQTLIQTVISFGCRSGSVVAFSFTFVGFLSNFLCFSNIHVLR